MCICLAVESVYSPSLPPSPSPSLPPQINLVHDVPCSGTVRAKTHCDILLLSKSSVSTILQHFPESEEDASAFSLSLPHALSLILYLAPFLNPFLLPSLFLYPSLPLLPSSNCKCYPLSLPPFFSPFFPPSLSPSLPPPSLPPSSPSLPPSLPLVYTKMKDEIQRRCDVAFTPSSQGGLGEDSIDTLVVESHTQPPRPRASPQRQAMFRTLLKRWFSL